MIKTDKQLKVPKWSKNEINRWADYIELRCLYMDDHLVSKDDVLDMQSLQPFPKTEQQRCIVHMVRNTLKYVANKDMKAFAKNLKTIYTSASEEAARKQLETVTKKWSGQYPSAMNRWHDNWDAISPIFKFSKDVRTAFYTANAIESLNE